MLGVSGYRIFHPNSGATLTSLCTEGAVSGQCPAMASSHGTGATCPAEDCSNWVFRWQPCSER